MNKQILKDFVSKNSFKLKQRPCGELELNPYVNYYLAEELAKVQQQEIESLKAQLAQLEAELLKHQSDDYVLVKKIPSEEVKDQINQIIFESIFIEISWGGVHSAQFECGTDESIYNAIIEAQEQQ